MTMVVQVNRLKGINLFRAAVRLVLEYIEWLTEKPVVEEVSDDIAINIRRAEQKKHEKKALTLEDRSYLLTRPEDRSEDERKYIYDLFKKFRVFEKYAESLKEILVDVCLYQYLRAGRVIVRQSRKPENLYFIVNGEVSASKVVTDRWTGETEEVDMGSLNPGDVFGEVALLHDIPRSATVVTKSMCTWSVSSSPSKDTQLTLSTAAVDLILIPRQDFNDILRSPLKKEWDVLQDALVHFNYFKSWDDVTIRECCILSKLKDFQPDEVHLHTCNYNSSHKTKKQKNVNDKANVLKVMLGDGKGLVNYVHFLLEGECRLIEHMIVRETHSALGTRYELYDPEKSNGKKEDRSSSESVETAAKMDEFEYQYETGKANDMDESIAQLLLSSRTTDRKMDFERSSIITTTLLDVVNEWHKITDVAEMLMREPSSISQQRYPIDVRTIFMQICTFNRGACFGLGENMVNRRIVAASSVKCFLVPRYWLRIHNRANIWERVKLFMDSKFPTKEQLFQRFLTNRRWLEYKKTLIEDIDRQKRRIHSNVTIHDVPYAIRIVNTL
ncbi:unnamed protein product [Heterotrigona itama]|uniref:Cyclic nucleotide-binding domain-containing protein n=1 Tax=Heterotrigona itama TaxID=395501 RepID=A0A6V7H279_9HYME|nr:unnamed protein product [Heterotrigona itama]